MSVLIQDFFKKQSYQYCSHIGRIQLPYCGEFNTDNYGFRTAYYNLKNLDLERFNSYRRHKIIIAGNSVSYGVGIINDNDVMHNIINERHRIPSFNISLRASTTFQDFNCIAQAIVPFPKGKIIWVGGLNDLLAGLIGNFSHPLFPPWFGESNIQIKKNWKLRHFQYSVEEKISIISRSIAQTLLHLSHAHSILFVWQPLWSLRHQYISLTPTENLLIDSFFAKNTGKMGQLYKSADFPQYYGELIEKTQACIRQNKSKNNRLKILNSNNFLPAGTLIDVTHLNELGHAEIVKKCLQWRPFK